MEALQRHAFLVDNVHRHGVAHENVLVHALNLLAAFNVPKALLPPLLIHNHGRPPNTLQAFNNMKALMINWSHLLEPSGPNSVSSLSISNDPSNQAFADGIFPVLSMDGANGMDGSVHNFTGGNDALDLSSPELGAVPVPFPPSAPCDHCGRPGQHHDLQASILRPKMKTFVRMTQNSTRRCSPLSRQDKSIRKLPKSSWISSPRTTGYTKEDSGRP